MVLGYFVDLILHWEVCYATVNFNFELLGDKVFGKKAFVGAIVIIKNIFGERKCNHKISIFIIYGCTFAMIEY